MLVFAAIAYYSILHVPFIGDDYVFLDKTRTATFGDLWSLRNTDFGWYRPWSRELHFWVLQRLFGPNETGFRIAGLLLWLAMLAFHFLFTQRVAGPRIAAIALLGLASLSLWGATLTWISGSQDLWMLCLSALSLWLASRGTRGATVAVHVAALLSKETAALMPIVHLAHAYWIDRLGWRAATRRVLPLLLVTAVWLVIHPTLMHRLTRPAGHRSLAESGLSPPTIAWRTTLSSINADQLGGAADPFAERRTATVVSSLVLGAAAWFTLRRPRAKAGVDTAPVPRRDLYRFAFVWAVAGWAPLFQGSIGWHAYYGSLGALGAWIGLAAWLDRWPRLGVPVIVALGLLRGHAAAVPSWDWGSEWYQTRAGNMLRLIRSQLFELHPAIPPHSRLYFGSIPNNVGLIAGDSPAVRVWYGDPSLSAGFYSAYRPRSSSEASGRDLFFHFDSSSGIREVYADGTPDPRTGQRDSAWERDHESLAIIFMKSGDLTGAARLFERIALLPHRPDAAMFAAVCWQAHGDSARAAADFAIAQGRTGGSPAEIAAWADRLRRAMPK